MKTKCNFLRIIPLLIALFVFNGDLLAQSAQVINPNGGASAALDDGLKVVVNTTGILSVYRMNQTQYFSGYVWPNGQGDGVALNFRFDNGATFNTAMVRLTACSTTAAKQNGNDWTTSISGYVTSPISSKKFFVTMNFYYTHPNRYFLVDYYVRAPFDLATPETVHLYLDHDAYILGNDASRGYQVQNTTGHFVGDFRNATDTDQLCNSSKKNPRYPSTHGFKTTGQGFRSYYAGPYGARQSINAATLKLSNTINANCPDDGIAVEFTIGPLAAGQTGTKGVLHAYGNTKGEFDNTPVSDPTPPTNISTPVTVNFTSATISETVGEATHAANELKIVVSEGRLYQAQVCNFTVQSGGTATTTDYSYVKGFIIPAGDYTTPQTLTLNNFTVLGTPCKDDKTLKIQIDSEVCNDLVKRGTTMNTTYTMRYDIKPTVNQPDNKLYCNKILVPANTISFGGSALSNTTYTWTNSNTSIGIAASGTGNLPAFTANNTGTSPITSTITVTPKQGTCVGVAKQFTITVNPTATVNAITSRTECNGATVPSIAFISPTAGTTFSWTNSNSAIGLAASGTSNNLPQFTATNSTTSPITSTITVTPSYGGCAGTPRTFTITVNPTATVNAITSRTECNGATVPSIAFVSPTAGTIFSWTNSNSAIGLAASGTGNNLSQFTATNSTTSPITSTITVTPSYGGCAGTPRTFTITVNPTATVNAITSRTECNGATVPSIAFISPTAGATFSWTNSNPSIGLVATSGTSNNLPQFTATNSTTSPITSTITVTPSYGGCTGTPRTFTITVNPTATVNALASRTVCVGDFVPSIPLTSPTAGATFSWSINTTAIGIPRSSGTGNTPAFNATNNTTSPITATITVIPSYGGCPGTPRTFTITVNPTATVDEITDRIECVGSAVPSIAFTSPTVGTTFSWINRTTSIGLGYSGTGDLPAFTATNTTASPITASITVTPKFGGCTGTPRTFTITVNPRTQVGSINTNLSVCAGMTPQLIKGDASTGGSGSFTYQWQRSTDNTTWTNIASATGVNYQPGVLTQSTYFRRNTIDQSCGTFIGVPVRIELVTNQAVLYWKKTATDSNWNNPANWVDANGASMNMVPLACTDVHIPASATKYPSLDAVSSPEGVYGKPLCDDITYHYGGEVAYPHLLGYNKAYVQYNWGYYGTLAGVAAGSQPTKNIDGTSAPKMSRDKWYPLSAPLKNMASGDFALAGYPLTWQTLYNMPNPTNGNLVTADLSQVFPTNDVNLASTYNTIAVKVASYNTNTIGFSDHRHLESLKGVIQVPFFQNRAEEPFRPGHQYDLLSKKSTFFYFDIKTLKQIYNPVGSIKRSDEAYRFIYEDNNNTVPNITVNGATVKGFSLTVSPTTVSNMIMIGNPFMASINSKQFFDANSTNLDQSEGYKIYSSGNNTWTRYDFSTTNNIAPLQAFLVKLKNTGSTNLLFPLEGAYALTSSQYRGSVRVSPIGSSLFVRSVDTNDNASDYAILTNEEGIKSKVKKMVSPEGKTTSEAFFITPDKKEYNLIQPYDNKLEEVSIGVKSANTKDVLKLEFKNVDEFALTESVHPVLEDKLLNIKYDLLKNNVYQFNQQKTDSLSQYSDVERFVLRLAKNTTGITDENNDLHGVVIIYSQGELFVEATQGLNQVQVYDIEGRLVHSSGTLANFKVYRKNLLLPQGSYIIRVVTSAQEIATKKIVAL